MISRACGAMERVQKVFGLIGLELTGGTMLCP